MQIRRMDVGDIPAGIRLCRLSGWNQEEADWRTFLESREGGGWLAERDGVTRGTVAFLRYGAHFSWIAMMLVHPGARRTGVGTQLMETVCDALKDDECVRLDATPLGEPLYRRFGFAGEYELVRATARGPAQRPVKLREDVVPIQPGDLEEIFARDREVFGADRGALLASFYQRAPGLAWTARSGGSLQGYCFGRPGYLYQEVGPVVAEDTGMARALVDRCLAGLAGAAVAVDVPRAATAWVAALQSAGFNIERPFLRMRRGENQWPGLPQNQFAIAGPEFG